MNQTHNVETRRTNLEKEKNIMKAKENHDLQEFTAFCEKEGINIKDENGHYKNTYDVLSEFARHWTDKQD